MIQSKTSHVADVPVRYWVLAAAATILACPLTRAADPVRRGPHVVRGADVGVGRMIPDRTLVDIRGVASQLRADEGQRATVVFLTGTGCPLCRKYSPTLAKIESRYRDRGVKFLYINPNDSESVQEVRTAASALGFKAPYIRDPDREFVRALGAETTTEAFVLDSALTLVYRGAIDDQYGFGYALAKPRKQFLIPAIEAVLAGTRPAVEATWAPGCQLFLDAVKTDSSGVTYHNRVSRILQDRCVACHRDGSSAPFSLERYEAVVDYSAMIRDVVGRNVMPPWFAAESDIRWSNDCSLSDAEKADVIAWLKNGKPVGNPQDAPLPRSFPSDWTIGTPDKVVQIPSAFSVPATGQVPYRYAKVKTHFPEGKWVQSVEIQPTDPSVVHHVLVFVETPEGELGDRDEGYLAAYVPGNTAQVNEDGYAKWLPPGATLVFQLHYTPNGKASEDQTRLGMVFAKEPPRYPIRTRSIANRKIAIPAGASDHRETASIRFSKDVSLVTLNPHMHLRGKAFRYTLIKRSETTTILDVPHYDFNWQLEYRPAKPIRVSAGTKIEITGWFDNSEANPANPDPEKTVGWGLQTDDEMLLGYIDYVVSGETAEDVESQ